MGLNVKIINLGVIVWLQKTLNINNNYFCNTYMMLFLSFKTAPEYSAQHLSCCTEEINTALEMHEGKLRFLCKLLLVNLK